MILKNRGATSNPEGRFESEKYEEFYDGWDFNDQDLTTLKTTLLKEFSKSIITTNDSPDIGFEQSINPYRGCEHGCIYCYARPAHAYMNLSPGLDFETKIFYKVDAAKLLENEITKKNYICKPIMLGANTDPYQPAEGKLKITRSILEVLHRYRHPVAIITKNSLIERDLDLLTDMAKDNLVKVAVSITSLSTKLKRILEPRTSMPNARLRIIEKLSHNKIPARVMAAPIIPFINDAELEKILQAASEAGALYASYVLIRLPHEVKILFKEWLAIHFPERSKHVMNIIRDMRDGKEYDFTFGQRMRGQGEYAELLAKRFLNACKRYKLNSQPATQLSTQHFNPSPQLKLWEL